MKFDLGHINKVAAVSLKVDADEVVYHFQIIRLKKGDIEIVKSGKQIVDLRSLIKKITNKIPIVLHIEGKGILNRKVEYSENYRHSLLMNARLDDFYFTDYIQNDEVYSSVIRKNIVNELLEKFKESHVEVISFCTGPFIGAPLLKHIQRSSYTIDNIEVSAEDQKVTDYKKSDTNRSANFIGDETLEHDQFGAFSLAAQQFYPSESIVLPEEPQVYEVNFNEAKQKNIFYRFLMGMLVFFLIILVANYAYLESLNQKIEENYMELGEFEGQIAELNQLEDEIKRKEKLLKGSGLLNRNFLSYYLMELSNSVPIDITLDNVSVRPVMEEIKKRHKIEFQEQLLLVHGKSRSSEILSRWIDELKQEEWLASVDILDYSYQKNVGNFELEIVLR